MIIRKKLLLSFGGHKGIIMEEQINQIIDEINDPFGDIRLIVGLSESGQSSVYAYSETQRANVKDLEYNLIFEIGSITKVFTTSLLSLLISKKKISLDTPICDIYSPLRNMSHEITLLHLATHTSGLPKIPPDAIWTSLRKRDNPYVDYEADKLMNYLSNYRKKPSPNQKINYSNVGMALLGNILSNELGVSYEEAVVNMICDKLNMPDTRINLSSEQKKRIAPPHSGGGKPSSKWDLPAFASAGALQSTAVDVLRFLNAHIGRSVSSITDSLQLSQKRYNNNFPHSNQLLRFFPGVAERKRVASFYVQSIGLGWMIGTVGKEGPEVHWHHGATGGYLAFTAFVVDLDIGIVILMNRGPQLLEMLSGISSADLIGFKALEFMCKH